MSRSIYFLCALMIASSAAAQDTHQHEAHVHGTGTLDVAIEDGLVSMQLRSPGADIVGFEHAAETTEDKATVSAALGLLFDAERLFLLSPAAGCDVAMSLAEVHSEEDTGHSEFHAEYQFACDHPEKLEQVEMPYFDLFGSAEELEIQVISGKGGFGAEVTRAAPVLDLRGRI